MAEAARPKSPYEILKGLPERVTGELIDGQLHTEPRPAGPHVLAAFNLGAELRDPYARGRGGPGGWWILIEPELHLVRDAEVCVPDLAGWRRERMPEVPSDQRFEIVPDWICEILSPATRSKDREIKMPLYGQYGVAYAWIVDPAARTVEVYEARGTKWERLATHRADDTVASVPFEAATFTVADLWR